MSLRGRRTPKLSWDVSPPENTGHRSQENTGRTETSRPGPLGRCGEWSSVESGQE